MQLFYIGAAFFLSGAFVLFLNLREYYKNHGAGKGKTASKMAVAALLLAGLAFAFYIFSPQILRLDAKMQKGLGDPYAIAPLGEGAARTKAVVYAKGKYTNTGVPFNLRTFKPEEVRYLLRVNEPKGREIIDLATGEVLAEAPIAEVGTQDYIISHRVDWLRTVAPAPAQWADGWFGGAFWPVVITAALVLAVGLLTWNKERGKYKMPKRSSAGAKTPQQAEAACKQAAAREQHQSYKHKKEFLMERAAALEKSYNSFMAEVEKLRRSPEGAALTPEILASLQEILLELEREKYEKHILEIKIDTSIAADERELEIQAKKMEEYGANLNGWLYFIRNISG